MVGGGGLGARGVPDGGGSGRLSELDAKGRTYSIIRSLQ